MDVIPQLLQAMKDFGLEWPEPVKLKRNEQLFHAGRPDTQIYYVEEGAIQIIHHIGDNANTIRFAYKGSLFAAMDSLLTGNPTAYSAEAIKQTSVRSVPISDFQNFIRAGHIHLELWNKILGYVIIGQLERETDLLTPSPRERYERVLKRSPRLFQEVPHRYIASYLRMTPETLSRLQKS